MTRVKYIGDCTQLDSACLRDMVDNAKYITRRTYRRWVPRALRRDVETAIGYAPETHRGRDLTMARDWHVSYHKSTYFKTPCVYFRWSGFEHVFLIEQG